jgi:hypothetical protein
MNAHQKAALLDEAASCADQLGWPDIFVMEIDEGWPYAVRVDTHETMSGRTLAIGDCQGLVVRAPEPFGWRERVAESSQ